MRFHRHRNDVNADRGISRNPNAIQTASVNHMFEVNKAHRDDVALISYSTTQQQIRYELLARRAEATPLLCK